jgi:hypothetical protein
MRCRTAEVDDVSEGESEVEYRKDAGCVSENMGEFSPYFKTLFFVKFRAFLCQKYTVTQ